MVLAASHSLSTFAARQRRNLLLFDGHLDGDGARHKREIIITGNHLEPAQPHANSAENPSTRKTTKQVILSLLHNKIVRLAAMNIVYRQPCTVLPAQVVVAQHSQRETMTTFDSWPSHTKIASRWKAHNCSSSESSIDLVVFYARCRQHVCTIYCQILQMWRCVYSTLGHQLFLRSLSAPLAVACVKHLCAMAIFLNRIPPMVVTVFTVFLPTTGNLAIISVEMWMQIEQ